MPRFALISCILVLLAPAAYYAPTFLLVADQPVKSDAVVLFLGGERGTREKEARQLLKEGWAGYLIIPARSQVQKLGPDGKFICLDLRHSISDQNQRTNELTDQRTSSSPKTRDSEQTSELSSQRTDEYLPLKRNHVKPKTASWIEDTHEEAVIARDLMARLGLRSAILVSSPYHMRRIKIIAGRVFDTQSLPPAKTGSPSRPSPEGQGEGAEKEYGSGFALRLVPTRYETKGDGFWLFNGYDRRFLLTEYVKIVWFLLYSIFYYE